MEDFCLGVKHPPVTQWFGECRRALHELGFRKELFRDILYKLPYLLSSINTVGIGWVLLATGLVALKSLPTPLPRGSISSVVRASD